jgi:hypothetical protein
MAAAEAVDEDASSEGKQRNFSDDKTADCSLSSSSMNTPAVKRSGLRRRKKDGDGKGAGDSVTPSESAVKSEAKRPRRAAGDRGEPDCLGDPSCSVSGRATPLTASTAEKTRLERRPARLQAKRAQQKLLAEALVKKALDSGVSVPRHFKSLVQRVANAASRHPQTWHCVLAALNDELCRASGDRIVAVGEGGGAEELADPPAMTGETKADGTKEVVLSEAGGGASAGMIDEKFIPSLR